MQERTLAIIKPDSMQKNLQGKIIDHLLAKEFKIIGMKMFRLTKRTAEEFYAVHKGRPFYDELVEFMTESAVVVLALQKKNAVAELRKVIGATDPAEAEEGTIRKLYAESKGRNAIHASDSVENAEVELSFFFTEKELLENGLMS